jgi:tRNA threonylcarbamoyl adenosine modification protein YeaZ
MVDKILHAKNINKNIALAVEGSAAEHFSVSVFQDEKLLQEDFYHQPQFSEALIPAIDKILKKNHISKDSIKMIFSTNGPGSFTSIRVVLSSLMAIALALKIPFYTVDALKTASFITNDSQVLVALKAYKGEFYTAFFDEKKHPYQTTNIQLFKPSDFLEKIRLQKYTLVGNAIGVLQEKWGFTPQKNQKIITENYLKSSNLAQFFFSCPDKEKYRSEECEPNYGKAPDTRLPYDNG